MAVPGRGCRLSCVLFEGASQRSLVTGMLFKGARCRVASCTMFSLEPQGLHISRACLQRLQTSACSQAANGLQSSATACMRAPSAAVPDTDACLQDAEGKQREKAERLRFGRFFYRFPNGESG